VHHNVGLWLLGPHRSLDAAWAEVSAGSIWMGVPLWPLRTGETRGQDDARLAEEIANFRVKRYPPSPALCSFQHLEIPR
jgi:hypothetical protein